MSLISLDKDVSALTKWLTRDFGALPFGCPTVRLEENLGFDGISTPGLIRLGSHLIERPELLSLTLAHEFAHQWWGLFYRSGPLPAEAMAEVIALRWLNGRHSRVAAIKMLRIARGRMFYAAFNPSVDDPEYMNLGRHTLVLYDIWQRYPNQFREFTRALLHERTAKNLASAEVSVWLNQPTVIPEPAICGGALIDRAETGLPFSIRLLDATKRVRTLRPEAQKIDLSNWGICEEQYTAILTGNVAADVALFVETTRGRAFSA